MLTFSRLFTGNPGCLPLFRGLARLDDETGPATVVEFPPSRGEIAIFHAVFIKEGLRNCIGRPVVPARIMIQIEPDRRNRARTDIGAAPAACPGHELHSDFEFRVLHPGNIAAAMREHHCLQREECVGSPL